MQSQDILKHAAEFIEDRLYFVTLSNDEQSRTTSTTHCFSIENVLHYESFFNDFGPLNISMLYSYCNRLNKKLSSASSKHKRIVHVTTEDKKSRVNAACLIGCYAILYLDFTPQNAYEVLNKKNVLEFIEFRDASVGEPYTISLKDCLYGFHRAKQYGFFHFSNFNQTMYEHYEYVENGDLNWIVPDKFIGFCGPHNKSRIHHGYPLHAPNFYFNYFKTNNVKAIIRLNKKNYDAEKFVAAGFKHYDLYFLDGSTPNDKILQEFLKISEQTSGALAVHCKAGLGRTGTLIACYIMKHYRFAAKEAIAWIRMCRPGSVIGHQQVWLESKQEQMWKEGEAFRRAKALNSPPYHEKGIYADDVVEEDEDELSPEVCRILKTVHLEMLEKDVFKSSPVQKSSLMTQGDTLNQIKAMRRQFKPLDTRRTDGTTNLDMQRKLSSTSEGSSTTNGTEILEETGTDSEENQEKRTKRTLIAGKEKSVTSVKLLRLSNPSSKTSGRISLKNMT
ncbi:PREDICTED: dual specificity protein phosphatase CDC14A-like isoform X2 [Nicrophorus vespilloides]|uniref:protein-tyrosine-phosphatase n=1 Tax=Nicrophorus vespilloides TaxID=110193 RepID=A0ABM1N626_NICVS|nr:PREDICTED: dual specificity protein phosphatase CDC14A-like isoform X2 [Nicrophorus vespilloides]